MSTIQESLAQWRRQQDGVQGLRKLFAVGCPKSGTTWLQNILHGHPQIVVQGEGCFAYQLVPLIRAAFIKFNEHQQRMPEYTRLRDVDLKLTLRNLIDIQFARYLEVSGKPATELKYVGDKTPQHTVGLSALNELYPEAMFIHIIRDPRDAAVSAWNHFGKEDKRTFEEYVRYFVTKVWSLNVGMARQFAQLLSGRYFEVGYERLIADERAQIRRMLEFLEVESTEPVIDSCVEGGSFEKKSGGRPRGQTDAASFYRTGRAGDWVNHLTRELAANCCTPVAELMRECDYDPSGAATSCSMLTSV